MNITDVRVRKVTKEGKMKAVVSITIDDEFVVHDIKVIEGEKGLFIAMPSRKATDGEYRDIAHPINSGTREKIQTIILKQYEQAMAEAEAEEAAAGKESENPEEAADTYNAPKKAEENDYTRVVSEPVMRIDFRVWGTKEQILALRDYMKQNNLKFGKVE